MERNSLEHLLHHFCGVTAKKEYQNADWRLRPLPNEMIKYQNADWRLRPLPDEMIKYAREDTHYLLYIYDLMRQRLQRESTIENDLLLEVQKRSNEICLQFYEKELLTDTSYLHIYGLQEHELNAKQLAVVAALHEWRDGIARQEDESTGYILPNKALIEIAKQMPTDTGHLKRIVKSKYPFVDSYLDQIVYNIWNALEYSYVYEGIAEQLKKERLEQFELRRVQASDKMTPLDAETGRSNCDPADQSSAAPPSTANANVASGSAGGFMSFSSIHLEDKAQTITSSEIMTSQTLSGLTRPNKGIQSNTRYQEAIQELKRPTLGASIGNSISGRQTENFGGFSNEQGGSNVDNFKSSVLPFQQFSGGVKHPATVVPTESLYPNQGMHIDNFWIQSTQMNEMIQLGNTTYYPHLPGYSTEVAGSHYEPEGLQMSSYLSGFEPGFQSINQRSTGTGQPPGRNKEGSFQNPARRQSFPPSGNRYDSTYP